MCWIEVTVSSTCGIISHVHTEHGRSIEVTCEDGIKYNINLQDKEEESTLEVTGDKAGENFNFLKIEHHGNDMYITLQGTKFSVKDENSVEETAKLEELLKNPDFSSFSTAVQQVHDKLKLPGWEYPSVLFLYRIGMSLHHPLLSLQGIEVLDTDILDYHGPSPRKQCQLNGWKADSAEQLIREDCTGTCGPTCKMCWQWVCGDCCIHTGCLRHDGFCRGRYGPLHKDCISLRGVLWDTITDTQYDC